MQTPLTHFASPDYWALYHRLPSHARETADTQFALLKDNPKHPSLHLKKIGNVWLVRAGIHDRVLGVEVAGEGLVILWFWIGSHAEYDRLIKRQ